MPRKSRAELQTTPVFETVTGKLAPPAGCPKPVAEEWNRLMARVPRGHFVAGDAESIRRYCEASIWLRKPGLGPKDWMDLTRLQLSLATRLRLVPSARRDKTKGMGTPGTLMSADDYLVEYGTADDDETASL